MTVGTGELARVCDLTVDGVQLAFNESELPATLVEAFRLAGAGHHRAARDLLTPERVAAIEAMRHPATPGCLQAQVLLGLVWQELGDLDAAIDRLTAAVTAEPNVAVYHMLANLHHRRGTVSDMAASRAQALALAPDHGLLLGIYPRDRFNAGDVEAGLHAMRERANKGQAAIEEHSAYLLHLHYQPILNQEALLAAHRQWAQQHTPPELVRTDHANDRDPDRPLRIGYLGADFCRHATSHALDAILTGRDPAVAQVFGYGNVIRPDAVTQRLVRHLDGYRSVFGVPDEAVARMIREDAIDILVAVGGHTTGHRLRVLAYKPAPIQVDWGWVNTTGMSQIDYRITDAWFDPPENVGTTVENLVRLPGGMSTFRAPLEAPPVSPLPALTRGHVTFGSCNNHLKINPVVVLLWARVLNACSGSSLIIKCLAGRDEPTRQRWWGWFAQHGIARERVTIVGWEPQDRYLDFHQNIDIALDTYPFNGCITTLEALWMGVPVVSLAGPAWVSRLGLSLLANLGFEKFVAHTDDQFVAKAMALAAQPEFLAQIRATLRPRLQASPVCNARRLAADLETAYRWMWRRFCTEEKI